MSCEEMLNTQSYLDGELDGAEAEKAERHLRSCAACQAFATSVADLGDALRDASRFPASHALRTAVRARLDRGARPFPPKAFWLGAAGGVGVSALAAALVLLVLLPASAPGLAQAIVNAHARALMGGETIAVASSDHHTVKPWLAAHAGLSPPAQDFAQEGFPLAGGRVDKVAGTVAAVAVYRHGHHELDLFSWPDRKAPLPPAGMARGFRIEFWKSADLDFAAVSDMDAASFGKFVALARRSRE